MKILLILFIVCFVVKLAMIANDESNKARMKKEV